MFKENINNDIINIDDGIYFDLYTSSFVFGKDSFNLLDRELIKNSINESIKNRRISRFNGKRTINTINIIPTMQCYGRCLYCYNKDNNNIMLDMLNINTIINNIDYIKNRYLLDLKDCRIYGGEPLLCKDIADIITKLYNDYNIKFYLSSGLLFDITDFTNIVCKLKTMNNIPISIGISLDLGCPNNLYTRKNLNNLTCHKLINRAKILTEETGIPVIIVTTISKNTDANILRKDINRCLDLLPNSALRFAIACDDIYHPTLKQIDNICDILETYVDNKLITNNIFPYYDVINSQNLVKFDDNIYSIVFNDTSCGVFSNMINMLPNGELIHCHMNPYDEITNINDFKNKNEIIYGTKECNECLYWRVCRGGCYYRKQYNKESVDSYCYWIKQSFILALKRLYSKHKNLKEYLNENINKQLYLIN
jgi:radical SAM protein with 4Fe4S-binding SPASM domain